MKFEGHDWLRQISEVSFHRARQRLRLELERIVKTGKTGLEWVVLY